jgi:hypothetical protein
MTCDVLLIHPPFWDMYSPPAATPALCGFLGEHGVACEQVDLNQIYFRASYDHVMAGAVADMTTRETFESVVPHEHKVVLRATSFSETLLADVGLAEREFRFERHRERIATWSTERLNAWDAFIHYGYFVRHHEAFARVLDDADALRADAWQHMRVLFEAHCLRRIREQQPAVVGFSILGEQQLAPTIALTAWLRKEFDGVVIWGGSDIRYSHVKMKRPQSWWRDLPDYLCLGEGETALLQLAMRSRWTRNAANRALWREELHVSADPNHADFIPGITPKPFVELPQKKYESVTSLAAYDFSGLALDGYLMPWPVVPYQASRGCHWGICAFCDHEEGYRLFYRPKEIVQVVDNLESFRDRFGITHLQFVDEAIEPEWLTLMNDEIERRGLSSALTPELLARSYANGCRLTLFGVESFNQRLLTLVRKGILRSEIFRTVRAAHDAGIRTWIWLISGLPTETPHEVLQNVEDLQSLRGIVDAVSVSRYRISANSDIYRELDRFGIVSHDLDHPADVVFEHHGALIDPRETSRLYYERYYPTAISMSVSHNRYLLFAQAIKEESGRVFSPQAAPSAPNVPVRGPQQKTESGLGNV